MLTERREHYGDSPDAKAHFKCRLDDGDYHNPYQYYDKVFPIKPHVVVSEEYTPNSTRTREWKNFEHYKCFRSPTGASTVTSVYHQGVDYYPHLYKADVVSARFGTTGFTSLGSEVLPFGEPGFPVQGIPAYHVRRADGGFVPPPATLDGLVQRGLNTTMPIIKADLSALNSLIELKDFKSLPGTLRRISNLIARPGRTLREILGGAADSYLQMQFNIYPLLSDIAALRAALSRAERQINDLLSRAGIPQRKHFTYRWAEYPEIIDQSSEAYLVAPPYGENAVINQMSYGYLTRDVRYEDAVFHMEVEYNFNYTQYQREHAHLLGLLDVLGVNFNPQIIWNALKWSFVVDWVLGVSRWLSQFKVTNMEPQINIRQCLWSIRRERRIWTWKHNASIAAPLHFTPTKAQLPVCTEVAYRRQTFMPGVSSIESSGLSAKEFSLAAALVLPRGRKRRKR